MREVTLTLKAILPKSSIFWKRGRSVCQRIGKTRLIISSHHRSAFYLFSFLGEASFRRAQTMWRNHLSSPKVLQQAHSNSKTSPIFFAENTICQKKKKMEWLEKKSNFKTIQKLGHCNPLNNKSKYFSQCANVSIFLSFKFMWNQSWSKFRRI